MADDGDGKAAARDETGAGGGKADGDNAMLSVAKPDPGRGPDGLVAVGLDIGTGWVKVSALGRRATFPSLYSCTYAAGAGEDDLGDAGESARPKAVLRDAVGEDATAMASGRSAILIRPVKHGVPHDGRGYSKLAAASLREVGIDDPGRAVICAGVPYDARGDRKRIRKLVVAAVKPAYCVVIPQASGTLKACGLKAGTVVNIGHGTTEIMRYGPEGIYGVSIQKASEFVLQQLAQRQGLTGRDAYTEYDKVLAEDPKMTARLVDLLAVHIADEVQQFGVPAGGEIILSGGGSRMPGMVEALSRAIGGGIGVRMVDEPSYSNAIGLEMMARDRFGTAQREMAKAASGDSTGGGRHPAGSGGAAAAMLDDEQAAGQGNAAATSGGQAGSQAPDRRESSPSPRPSGAPGRIHER